MTALEQRLIEELQKERAFREELQKQLIAEMNIQMKEIKKDFIEITQPLINELKEKVSEKVDENKEDQSDITSQFNDLSAQMTTIIKLLKGNSASESSEKSLQELFEELQTALALSLKESNEDLITEIRASNTSLTEAIDQFYEE